MSERLRMVSGFEKKTHTQKKILQNPIFSLGSKWSQLVPALLSIYCAKQKRSLVFGIALML